SIMSLGLQQRDARGRVLREFPSASLGNGSDAPAEQILFDADGQPWVVGGMGVLRFHDGGFVTVPGVAPGSIFDIAWAAPDTVWLARQGALERYHWDGRRLALREQVGAAQGVPAVQIGGMVPGRDGEL